MLTIAHANRSKPTLKDDERFRNGLAGLRSRNETQNIMQYMLENNLSYNLLYKLSFKCVNELC